MELQRSMNHCKSWNNLHMHTDLPNTVIEIYHTAEDQQMNDFQQCTNN
jgi:hypothetical protein